MKRTTKLKIKGKEYKLAYTVRSMFLYEKITGKPFSVVTVTDQMLFFYCLILANNPDMKLSFQEFIDDIDNKEVDLKELQKFIAAEQAEDSKLVDEVSENNKDNSKKKSASKKE